METNEIKRVKVQAVPNPILMRRDHYVSAKIRHLTDLGFNNITEERINWSMSRVFGGHENRDIIDENIALDLRFPENG